MSALIILPLLRWDLFRILLLDYTRILVQFIGSVKLAPNIVLENVLYVPQFKFNLISMSTLVEKDTMSLNFFSHTCIIQDTHTLKTIGKANLIEGLYVFDADTEVFDSIRIDHGNTHHATITNVVSKTTWHSNLGHLSFKKMDIIKAHLH